MTRRKVDDQQRLTRKVTVRLSIPFYNRLEALVSKSNCRTVSEVARKILYEEKIIVYHKDTTLEGVAAELAGIKKELRAIGGNINQITRYFNSTAVPNQKIFEALKILDEYKKTGKPVEKVLTIISNIKWSPK
jgi:hypothetical protein